MRAGQSERRVPPAPIRTPDWSSRLSGQRRILFTQSRGTPEHERHLVMPSRRLYFPQYIFPPLTIVPFWFRGSRHGWGLYVEYTWLLHMHSSLELKGLYECVNAKAIISNTQKLCAPVTSQLGKVRRRKLVWRLNTPWNPIFSATTVWVTRPQVAPVSTDPYPLPPPGVRSWRQ